MPLDVSYGELIVIDGVDVNENIVQAGQHAIAYATTRGAPGGAALIGISAETFYFSENVDVSKNVGLRGNLDVSGTAYIHNVLDVSKNALFRSNVGIGTENPNNKLEVVGDICCTTLKFDSSANQTNIVTYNRNPLSSLPLDSNNNFTGERFTLKTERSGSFMKFYSDTLSSSTSNNDSSIRFDGALGNAHFKGKVAIGMGETAPGQHLQIDADEQSAGLLISDITNKNDNVSLIFSSGTTGGGGVGSTGQIGGMCLNYHCKLGPGPTSANAGPKGGLRFQRCDEYRGGSRTDLMVLTASGELGIGTLYPTTPLEIITTKATNSGGLLINNTSSGTDEHAKLTLKVASSSGVADPYISFQTDGGSGSAWSCGVDNDANQAFKIAQSGNQLNTNTKLTITTDGKVGIGITNPSYPLEIVGGTTGATQVQLCLSDGNGGDSTGVIQGPDSSQRINFRKGLDGVTGTMDYHAYERHRFYVGTDTTTVGGVVVPDQPLRMIIKNGNVGIGTTNPLSALHISGAVTTTTPPNAIGIFGGIAGSGAQPRLEMVCESNNTSQIIFADKNGSADSELQAKIIYTGHDNTAPNGIDFQILAGSGGSKLFINSTGVGIGTADPQSALHVGGEITTDITGGRVLTTTNDKVVAASVITSTELGYLDGVTSLIQNQLDSKQPELSSGNRLNAIYIGSNGNVNNTEFGYLNGVTSSIQNQLGLKAPKSNPAFTGTVAAANTITANQLTTKAQAAGEHVFINVNNNYSNDAISYSHTSAASLISSPTIRFTPHTGVVNTTGYSETILSYADINCHRGHASDDGLRIRTIGAYGSHYYTGGGNKTWQFRARDGYLSTPNGTAPSSDDRLKHNEVDISNAIATINKIRPMFYIKSGDLFDQCGNKYGANHNFTQNDLSNGLPWNCIYESGYIAQDISNISELKHTVLESGPDASGNEGKLSLNYTGIQPYLTKAVQELHQIVQTQETTIGSLQTLISTLQTQNTALEARIAALES